MKYIILSLASVATFTAMNIGTAAAEEPDTANAARTKDDGDGDKKICRRVSAGTGSIMPKRICHTQAEWNAMEEAGKRDMERAQGLDRSRAMVGASR